VIPQLLSAASDTEARRADGGLPVTLFHEVLCYLLNHLREYLPEYNQSAGAASFDLFSDDPVSNIVCCRGLVISAIRGGVPPY
jgi:hypothetical protein